MTDRNQTLPLPWQTTLAPGDLVAYRFPHERDGDETPKVRPTLVLDVLHVGEERYALLAYGTTSRRSRARALLVPVTAEDELATASLKAPTQFDGARRILVTLSNPGFRSCRKYQSPVLGRLSGTSAEQACLVRRRVRQQAGAHRSSHYRTRSVGTPGWRASDTAQADTTATQEREAPNV